MRPEIYSELFVHKTVNINTQGTAGGPGGRDRTLAVKLFRTWEIPRSGSKAKNGEKKRKEREREREKD